MIRIITHIILMTMTLTGFLWWTHTLWPAFEMAYDCIVNVVNQGLTPPTE